MINRKLVTLYFLLIIFTFCAPIKSKRLYCLNEQDLKKIKNVFNADSVVIFETSLKEELYFEKLFFPSLKIYNPKTKILNFKNLPVNNFQRIENWQEVEDSLKIEGKWVAEIINLKCNKTSYNDLMINFCKKDLQNQDVYNFIIHYDY